MTQGFPEEQLVQNRSAVLLYGGGDPDRRAWAGESAQRLRDDGALTTLQNEADLAQALADGRRVLFVPDLSALSHNAQGLLVKTLLEREDRPKLILALPQTPMEARQKGKLRDDLAYRLQLTQVDLSAQGLKAQLKERRAKLERELERRKAEAERHQREAERQARAQAKEAAQQARAAEALLKKSAPAAKKAARKTPAAKKSKPARAARPAARPKKKARTRR